MAHVLITGGTRGIGRAMVRVLAQEGHHVCFFYNNSIETAQAMMNIARADGYDIFGVQCDISDGHAVAENVAMLQERWGHIDVLINNAGISWNGLIQDMLDAEWMNLFDVNVHGAFYTIKAVLPQMISRGKGNIINISSIWGERGASCEVAYSASKGAIDSMTKALAQELAYSGVRVNAIAPGVVRTDMMAALGEETENLVLEEIPMGRYATPEEIARVALFLMGPDADYITGQIITVAGGYVV